MNKISRGLCAALATVGFSAAISGAAIAQDYPSQPVQIIAPFSAGGSIDIVSRLIAPELEAELGQPFVVVNRPGASSIVGSEYVLRQAADGHSLLINGVPYVTQIHMNAEMPFDPLEAFEPVSIIAIQPNVMMVNPDLGVSTVEEFIALAREKPGELNFASSGIGASQHLAGALLMQLADIEMEHVPYQGGGPAMVDLLGGRVALMMETAPGSMRHVESGALVPLGVTTHVRLPAMPDVPTLDEAGVPGYEFSGWMVLLAPAGTPKDVIDTLHAALVRVLEKDSVSERLTDLGLIVDGRPPAAAAEFLAGESKVYGDLIRSVGIEPK